MISVMSVIFLPLPCPRPVFPSDRFSEFEIRQLGRRQSRDITDITDATDTLLLLDTTCGPSVNLFCTS